MSIHTDSEAPTKMSIDDNVDSGLLSGPMSDYLQEDEQDKPSLPLDTHGKQPKVSETTQLDSGLDLTISEDLSHIKLSSEDIILESKTELTNIERSQPLINITEEKEDIPPLAILFQQDDDGDTQLHISAVHGCQKSVSTLIRVCPDTAWLDVPNDFGHTALHLSVLSGHAVVARMLVLAGASVSIRDLSGQNPLHLAALAGHVECIKALIVSVPERQQRMQSSVLNQKNYNGQTSVHLAAMAGHVEAVHTLVFYGADINAMEGLCGFTALHVAAARGDTALVTYLARRCPGVWLDARDYAGRTARRHARTPVVKEIFNSLPDSDVFSETEESDDEDSSDCDLFEEVKTMKAMATVA